MASARGLRWSTAPGLRGERGPRRSWIPRSLAHWCRASVQTSMPRSLDRAPSAHWGCSRYTSRDAHRCSTESPRNSMRWLSAASPAEGGVRAARSRAGSWNR